MHALSATPVVVAVRDDGLAAEAIALVRSTLEAAGIEVTDDEREAQVVIGGASIGMLEQLRATSPVVVVADNADRGNASELLGAGASAVITQHDVSTALAAAVLAVRAGLVVVSREGGEAVRRPVLTAREKEILGLLVMGLTNADIARRLFLAESTVKYHLLGAYRKLGVRTRKQAAAVVLDPRNGLAPGIVSVTGASRARRGYSRPTLE